MKPIAIEHRHGAARACRWMGSGSASPRTSSGTRSIESSRSSSETCSSSTRIEARTEAGCLGRVEKILCASSALAVAAIHEGLLTAVRSWTPLQQDDVTLLIARRER
jgi:hypothetical protein